MPTTTITPENTLRSQRINFDVNPGRVDVGNILGDLNSERVNAPTLANPGRVAAPTLNTQFGTGASADMIQETFGSMLPGMNLDFMDAADTLARRTSSLGRAGSGMFTREAGQLTDRARATREALLGNLGFQAHQSDLNREVQAQQMRGQQEQAQAGMGLQAGMFNVGQQSQADQMRAQLQAQTGMFNAGQANQFGLQQAQLGLQGDMFNVSNDLQTQLAGMQHLLGQQGREDRLASEAHQSELQRLGLLSGLFQQTDPMQGFLGAADIMNQGANRFAGGATQGAQDIAGVGQNIGRGMQGGVGRPVGGGIAAPPMDFNLPNPTNPGLGNLSQFE